MNILGIHLDFPYVRISLIQKRRRRVQIRTLKTISLQEESDVKPLYTENFKGRVVSALSAKDFLIRLIEIKAPGGPHLEETLTFQSEALNHFNPEEVLTVPFFSKTEKSEALLFTVLKERFREHLKKLEELEIDPDVVSTVPSALSHFIRWKFPTLTDAFIIDLGSSGITCVLIEGGRLKKAHSVSRGVETLLNALYEDRKKTLLKKEIEGAAKQIDLLLLKSGLNLHLSEELNEIRQEIAKIFYSFNRNEIKPIIFTGRVDAFIHFREFLTDSVEGEWVLTPDEQKFAVSTGLALEQTSSYPLQLRRGEFFPQKNWARMGLYALSLLAGSLILSATLLGFGLSSNSLSKQQMVDSLQTTSIQKLFTEGAMEEQIDHWIAEIETNTKEYPYIPQTPKVTQTLSWLSYHPLLREFKKEGDPIQLRELKYQLVSFPKINSDKEPFLAKVELEFNFKSLMNARKFHEALREGDEWVDPNLEIDWDTLSNGYRASFYMKNRSPYVP